MSLSVECCFCITCVSRSRYHLAFLFVHLKFNELETESQLCVGLECERDAARVCWPLFMPQRRTWGVLQHFVRSSPLGPSRTGWKVFVAKRHIPLPICTNCISTRTCIQKSCIRDSALELGKSQSETRRTCGMRHMSVAWRSNRHASFGPHMQRPAKSPFLYLLLNCVLTAHMRD